MIFFLTGAANQKLPTYAEATTLPTYEEAERSKFQEAHQDSDSNLENPDVCPYFYIMKTTFFILSFNSCIPILTSYSWLCLNSNYLLKENVSNTHYKFTFLETVRVYQDFFSEKWDVIAHLIFSEFLIFLPGNFCTWRPFI